MAGTAGEHNYFYEDGVYRITKKGNVQFGMVLENSELVSGDESSDEEEGGRMKKGHIRVAWHPNGVEEVIPERKVKLADRSLMPGDVVRRLIKGKDTQRGYCRHIRVAASVQVVGTTQVISSVDSANLVPLEEFGVDIAACLDSWVGGIKTVHSKLTLRCSDGSRCIINDVDACDFENFTDKRDMDFEFPGHRDDFYPGQTLWGPVHCLEDANWITCSKEMKANCSKPNKSVKVIVEDVQTENVGIHWQCRAYSKDGASADKEQPKYIVEGEDLKRLRLLNVFEPCTQQVGDRSFYTFRDGDKVISKEQWRRSQYSRLVGPTSPKRSPKRSKFATSTPAAAKPVVSATTLQTDATTAIGEGAVPPPASELMPPPPPPPAAEHDEWETDETASASDTLSISSEASSAASHGKKKRGPTLMTRMLKGTKLRRTKKRAPNVKLEPGSRVVVETLSTHSVADVVWQDGTVEETILSTQLYPIHHLDDQEFFPGDYVIENRDDGSMRVYGVVQSVDHLGRTATVKWFRTYTSVEDPCPALLEETEVSVYDMKDHPDFQYRPGTVVIRVANFEGEDASCTAGQVLDNYPKGMVRVWWVDGHVSMSWPQDLYKVGEYDSDEGELWDDGSSDGSWETESEECCIPDDDFYEDEQTREKMKPKLGANIEKARIAMSRLEEIFMQNPTLQTTAVMRQLLEVYKDCRYLDKLMGTSFFHENHFQGLLERVRERGRANTAQRVADQVNRLFYHEDGTIDNQSHNANGEVTAAKRPSDAGLPTNGIEGETNGLYENDAEVRSDDETTAGNSISFTDVIVNVALLERKLKTAVNNNRNAGNDLEAFKDDKVTPSVTSKVKTEGGKASKAQSDGKEAKKHAAKHVTATAVPHDAAQNGNANDTSQASPNVMSSNANSQVCAKLCALIKGQLVKAHAEVTRRFGGNQTMTLSGAVNSGSDSSQKSETDGTDLCLTSNFHLTRSIIPCTVLRTGEGVSEASGKDSLMALMKESLDCIVNHFTAPAAAPPPAAPAAAAPVPSADDKETEKQTDKPKRETDSDKATQGEMEGGEDEAHGDNEEGFSVADCAPNSHNFKLTIFQPVEPSSFFKAVRKEHRLLHTSLPPGIWVKGFEDRMDLYSVMIRGPEKTPYEDGLFFFDFQLSADYPRAPPLCHYVSYCSDRLNPNLYEEGKVCVSLLGTWSGKGTEVWTVHSTLLQVIISIQGLILVSEPYFNEAGYEKQKGSQSGSENSRMYNEMAVLKLVQSLSKMILHPPAIFQPEIVAHFTRNSHKFLHRLNTWLDISERYSATHPVTPTTPSTFRESHPVAGDVQLPEFPLIPASKGFCLTLRKTIVTFREVLASVGIHREENREEEHRDEEPTSAS